MSKYYPENKYHPDAVQFAEDILRRLGHNHRMAEITGEAELLWDIAYDAYMYRVSPALPGLGGSLTLRAVQDDNAFEEETP